VSDKPISVGDLAIIVRASPCCGNTASLGRTFRISDANRMQRRCTFCGTSRDADGLQVDGQPYWVDRDRVKRIPPPEELGIVNERGELTA
jgi:hypothetical protein